MWLGPPDMNRKTTDLALALSGMCGVLAASGFMLAVVAARRSCCCSMAPKASAPKPQNASQRNSRRLRVIRICSDMVLVHVQKRVQVEHRQGKLARRLRFEKCDGLLQLFKLRWTPRDQAVSQIHLLARIGARFGREPLGQRFSLLVGQIAVQQLQRLRSVRARFAARTAPQRIGSVEHFHKRQAQIALGDEINTAPVVLRLVLA